VLSPQSFFPQGSPASPNLLRPTDSPRPQRVSASIGHPPLQLTTSSPHQQLHTHHPAPLPDRQLKQLSSSTIDSPRQHKLLLTICNQSRSKTRLDALEARPHG
ncbi:hypothetical protein HNY73_011591, partial [Argiope bruennichi]